MSKILVLRDMGDEEERYEVNFVNGSLGKRVALARGNTRGYEIYAESLREPLFANDFREMYYILKGEAASISKGKIPLVDLIKDYLL